MQPILWPGPAGNIEMLLTQPDEPSRSITVIICHPHPLYGGTMSNKVVTTLAKTFHEKGLSTVRFNFRGVGKSEGVHDEGRGETDDVLAIAEWIKAKRPQDTLWLAGFSFGGFVAAKAAVRLKPEKLLSVAPQVSRFAGEKLAISCPWFIIQGDQDDIISPAEVAAWIETQDPKPTLICISGAGHFFHGKLGLLRKVVEENM